MAIIAEFWNTVRMIVRQRTAGCSPRSRAAFSIMAISLGENESIIRSVRLGSGGGRSSKLIGSFGRGRSRRGGIVATSIAAFQYLGGLRKRLVSTDY